MQTNTLPAPPLAFRITIGVTGHRTISSESLPALRKTLQLILDDIKMRHAFRGKTSFGWRILTPLAEGADRLVAEEILKRPEGATLKAILPLTVPDYLEDFPTDSSKDEFQRLIARDRSPVTLQKHLLKADYPLELLAEARLQAYEDVGRFVVDHCDILIALWDGRESQRKGGTARTVAYADEQKCPRYTIFTSEPTTFTFKEGIDKTWDCYKSVDHLNRKIAKTPSPEDKISQAYDRFFPSKTVAGDNLPGKLKTNIKSKLLPYYAAVDHIALGYQKLYMRTGTWVFALALTATALVAASVIFFSQPSWLVFAIEFLILSAIAGAIIYADRIKKAHRNWRSYRFLAERIRCAVFLAVSGVEPEPRFFPKRGNAAVLHQRDHQWLLMVFEEIWHKMALEKMTTIEAVESRRQYILAQWIEDQLNYHAGNARTKTRKSKTYETIGEIIFYYAMGAAALHLVFVMLGTHLTFIDNLMVFIALILPSVAAMAESLRTHRQFKYLATHSLIMAAELRNLHSAFKMLTPKRFEELLLDADRLMMEETQEWIALTGSAHLYKAV